MSELHDEGWLTPDETPDGKVHYLAWVANTSGQYHVYLDGVHEATWVDQRPSHIDLWRVMARRFGRGHWVRALAYRALRLIPSPQPWPDYGVPKGAGYSEEILSDAPFGYWRLGDRVGGTYPDSSGHGNHGTHHE